MSARQVMVGDDIYDNLTQAAEGAHVSRPTISRHLKSGKPLNGKIVRFADAVAEGAAEIAAEVADQVASGQRTPEPPAGIDVRGLNAAQLKFAARTLLQSAQQLIEQADQLNQRANAMLEAAPQVADMAAECVEADLKAGGAMRAGIVGESGPEAMPAPEEEEPKGIDPAILDSQPIRINGNIFDDLSIAADEMEYNPAEFRAALLAGETAFGAMGDEIGLDNQDLEAVRLGQLEAA